MLFYGSHSVQSSIYNSNSKKSQALQSAIARTREEKAEFQNGNQMFSASFHARDTWTPLSWIYKQSHFDSFPLIPLQ